MEIPNYNFSKNLWNFLLTLKNYEGETLDQFLSIIEIPKKDWIELKLTLGNIFKIVDNLSEEKRKQLEILASKRIIEET